MMSNRRECGKARSAANRAHNEVITAMKKFAKRGKHIDYNYSSTHWGMCNISMTIHKDGKVSAEMLEYVKSICPYTTDGVCFHSYEEGLEFEETEIGMWKAIGFSILVIHK